MKGYFGFLNAPNNVFFFLSYNLILHVVDDNRDIMCSWDSRIGRIVSIRASFHIHNHIYMVKSTNTFDYTLTLPSSDQLINKSNRAGKLGVPSPETGSQPFAAKKPVVPQFGLLPLV